MMVLLFFFPATLLNFPFQYYLKVYICLLGHAMLEPLLRVFALFSHSNFVLDYLSYAPGYDDIPTYRASGLYPALASYHLTRIFQKHSKFSNT